MKDIETAIKEIISNHIDIPLESLNDSSSIWSSMEDMISCEDEGGGESVTLQLPIVEMIMNLEDDFDMELSSSDFASIKTVGEVIAYMKEKISG